MWQDLRNDQGGEKTKERKAEIKVAKLKEIRGHEYKKLVLNWQKIEIIWS